MRRCSIVLALFVLIPVAAGAQVPDSSLQDAFDRLAAAWTAHDVVAWAGLVDPNALIEHTDGCVHVKAVEVEHIRNGGSKPSPRIEGDDRLTISTSGKTL